MSSDLTPDRRCERVRMCLAEAGWPDAGVEWQRHRMWAGPTTPYEGGPPNDVWWRALTLSGEPVACWPCFSSDEYMACADPRSFCDHDPLTEPWPATRTSPQPPTGAT